MKYIDSEKLIAEIERYENTAIDAYNPHGEDADFWDGTVVACEDIKAVVTSLQQDHLADVSKMVASEHIADVSKMMEQPEAELDRVVDLAKEIVRYQREDMDRDTTVGDVARHFYELGRNARKERSSDEVRRNLERIILNKYPGARKEE